MLVPEVTPPDGSDVVITQRLDHFRRLRPDGRAGRSSSSRRRRPTPTCTTRSPRSSPASRPSGDQLWAIELAGDLAANYEGRGSILFDSLDDNQWSVVDALTGETVASGGLADGSPVTTLSPTLVDDLAGGLIELPGGRTVGRDGDYDGAGRRRAGSCSRRSTAYAWSSCRTSRDLEGAGGHPADGIWTEAADLSTSTVVAFGPTAGSSASTSGRVRVKWSSDVPRSDGQRPEDADRLRCRRVPPERQGPVRPGGARLGDRCRADPRQGLRRRGPGSPARGPERRRVVGHRRRPALNCSRRTFSGRRRETGLPSAARTPAQTSAGPSLRRA